ncbi:MAG: hypothetical protein Q4A28_02290 [Brachymonas sp.]|nr:hypothetical protein [Brachymonas sp.]
MFMASCFIDLWLFFIGDTPGPDSGQRVLCGILTALLGGPSGHWTNGCKPPNASDQKGGSGFLNG